MTRRARTALAFIGGLLFFFGVYIVKDAAILSLIPICAGLALVVTANAGK